MTKWPIPLNSNAHIPKFFPVLLILSDGVNVLLSSSKIQSNFSTGSFQFQRTPLPLPYAASWDINAIFSIPIDIFASAVIKLASFTRNDSVSADSFNLQISASISLTSAGISPKLPKYPGTNSS